MKKTFLAVLVLLMATLAFAGCDRNRDSVKASGTPLAEMTTIGIQDGYENGGETVGSVYVMLTHDEIFDMYTSAVHPISESSSSTMSVFATMRAESHGTEQVSMAMSGHIRQTLVGTTGPEIHMEMLTIMDGMEIPVSAFYRNGMYYVDMNGVGIRMPMDYRVLAEQTHVGIDDFLFQEYSILHNYGFQLPDGGYDIFFTLASSAVYHMVEREMREVFNEVNQLTFSDIRVNANLNEARELEAVSYDISFAMETEGQPINVWMSAGALIEELGNVVIEFPEELNNFVLVDEQIMTLMNGDNTENIAVLLP